MTDYTAYEFETHPGLPPVGEPGVFLIDHAEHGLMLARWSREAKAFVAVGFTGEEKPPLVMTRFVDEQVSRCRWWAHLPTAAKDAAA